MMGLLNEVKERSGAHSPWASLWTSDTTMNGTWRSLRRAVQVHTRCRSALGAVLAMLVAGACLQNVRAASEEPNPETPAQASEGSEEPNPGSKYPRPNLASEGQAIVRENGLSVKFFESESEQGKGDLNNGRKYILYEPPIFLLTRRDGENQIVLDTSLSHDGTVTVSFLWDTDPEKTRDAIRNYLNRTPGYGSALKDAIIKPLFVNSGWMEQADDTTVRSQVFPPQSFNAAGKIHAYFNFGSKEEAERFVDALNAATDTLAPVQFNFRYSFTSVPTITQTKSIG